METKILSITNQKGGVAKTTTSQALITGLANRGYKILGIDLDPQSNLSFAVGSDSNKPTIYNALKNEVDITDTIQNINNFDFISSNILLSGVDVEFTQTGREYILKEKIESIKSNYDYIIIDNLPSLSLLAINSFVASDYIIIPVNSDVFSLQGIGQLNDTINNVKKYCNNHLEILGILMTKYHSKQKLSSNIKSTLNDMANQLNTQLFKTYIRESVAIKEAQIQQQNLLNYDKNNNAIIDYNTFVDELISKLN